MAMVRLMNVKGNVNRCATFGTVVRFLAQSKRTLYYLVLTQERHGCRRVSPKTRGDKGSPVPSAGCIVALNRTKAVTAAKAEEARLVATVAKDSIDKRIRLGLAERLAARLRVDLAGQFHVRPLAAKQLGRLLGAPAFQTGRVAQLSEDDGDLTEDAATVIVGMAAIPAGASATAAMVAPGIAAGTTATLASAWGGSLAGAAAGQALRAGRWRRESLSLARGDT